MKEEIPFLVEELFADPVYAVAGLAVLRIIQCRATDYGRFIRA